MYIDTIITGIKEHKVPSRSVVLRAVRAAIIEQGKLYEAAEVILEEALYGVKKGSSLTTVSNNVNRRIYKLLGLSLYTYASGEMISSAVRMLDYLGDYITAEVRECVKADGSVDYLTIIISKCDTFEEEAQKIEDDKFDYDPTQGPREWTGFELQVAESRSMDLVKKARRYGLQGRYSPHIIPEVYSAINRLQRTPYGLHGGILRVSEGDFLFNTEKVCDDEKKKAVRAIAQMKKKAKRTNSVQRLEESDWFADQSDIVSRWSKRFEFEQCRDKAKRWLGETLHFVYTLDSRSRMYSTTSFLHPQGSDFAKALLKFAERRPIDVQTFAVITANHAGRDKLSFQDRIQWVEDNIEDIINIGLNPLSMQDKLVEWEIDKEDKSRWQFLACCMEWARYWDEGAEGFETDLVCALDATCSALQIATVISRDERMAQHVNLVRQEKPGDIYKISGNEMLERMSSIDEINKHLKRPIEEITEGLQSVIDHSSIRKVAKRPQMVADYSGTMQGMKTMTYTDRFKTGIEDITKKDANVVGELLYGVTNDPSRGSTKIKEFLRSGVQYHEGGAMITWRTRDNFLCFQVADRSKEQSAKGSLGGKKVELTYYLFQDIPNRQKHQNLICPNITHSIDATIVRCIANGMPEDAPLAMVHDSYGTSSDYTHLLLPLVLDAFMWVGDREWYEDMVAEMFGVHRPLPTAGALTDEQIMEANYAVC